MNLLAPSSPCCSLATAAALKAPAACPPFSAARAVRGVGLHRARYGRKGGKVKRADGGVDGNPYDEAGRSPGAGAETSEDQADAAYADLLYTSMVGGDEEEEPLGDWDAALEEAKKGDTSSGWADRKSKGAVSDVLELFKSLSGGAHIVRGKDGRV